MSSPNANATTADFEFAALWEAANYRAAIVHEFQQHLRGHLLEVGCGIGQMTREFQLLSAIDRITCIEPDQGFAAKHAKDIQGAELLIGTAGDLPPTVEADSIVSINVLEHIEQDQEEMTRYARLLKSRRGHLCALVPARPEIYAPLDKDFGHFRRYTAPELREKLEKAGFKVEKLHYFNLVGYFAWWFSFCLRKQRSFGIQQVRFYDRIIFPVINAIETNAFRPPIGQSLIAIARAK
ncbi:MAG: class I SAM-dependent methyltransferase [Verrucomicrobiales bacterium]